MSQSNEGKPVNYIEEGLKAIDEMQPKAEPPAPAPAQEQAATETAQQKPAVIEKSFEKLARERAEFRAEQERIKPYIKALESFSPVQLNALQRAAANKNPNEALAALGLKPPEPPAALSELEQIKAEMAELKQFRSAQLRTSVLEQVKSITNDSPLISKLGAHNQVLEYIETYTREHQQPLGDTLEESIAIAAGVVEESLKKEAAKWRLALSVGSEVNSQPSSSPQQSEAPPSVGTSMTLSNQATNAPTHNSVRDVPKTREEYLADALEYAKKDLGW